MTEYQICTKTVMDTTDPTIVFNKKGQSDYYTNYINKILPNWHTDQRGYDELMLTAKKIKKEGVGKDFDCIIGMSGGLDSSYTLYVAKEIMGLRPLVFHVDAGWNSERAVGNIEKLVKRLDLDLYTEVINWEEMKDLQVAFLKSQISDQDLPQDCAFFSGMYKFAKKNKIKYVLTGANFSTECCREPEEWGAYPGIDSMLFNDIHSKFGKRQLKTFPIVDILKYKIYYRYVKGMKVFKPLNLVPFIKKDAEQLLCENYGWEKYKHKHHESRFTRFYEDSVNKDIKELTDIKINNKILHQSKLINYFREEASQKKITKDLNDLLKKVKKNKKYYFSKKDVILVEAFKSDGIKVSDKFKNLYKTNESEMPSDIQIFINNGDMATAMLRIVEVIGQDEIINIDEDTLYFIISTLNQLDVDPIRNKILLKVLPLKV